MIKITEFRADIALIITAVIWGASYLPVASSTLTNGVFTILFWRYLISFFIMALIAYKFDKKFDINSVKYGLILGTFLFIGFSTMTFAFRYTFTSSVSFAVGLNVVFVPIFMYLLFRQKMFSYAYVGVALGAFGLYLLTKHGIVESDSEAFRHNFGLFLSIICAAFWSLHIIFTSIFSKKCELFTLIATQFAVLTLFSAAFAIFFEGSVVPVLDKNFYVMLVITVLFSTIFGFIMQNLMLRYTTPVKAAIIFTLEPISAGVIGYFVGGEMLSSVQILGAAVILAGILTSEIGSYLKAKNV